MSTERTHPPSAWSDWAVKRRNRFKVLDSFSRWRRKRGGENKRDRWKRHSIVLWAGVCWETLTRCPLVSNPWLCSPKVGRKNNSEREREREETIWGGGDLACIGGNKRKSMLGHIPYPPTTTTDAAMYPRCHPPFPRKVTYGIVHIDILINIYGPYWKRMWALHIYIKVP